MELSVLLEIGIEPYNTRENIVLADIPNDVGNGSYTLYGTVVSSGFDDTELNLFVFDNMNGLVAVDDENRMILNDYNFLGAENGFITSSSYNKELDDIFRKREIDKSKRVSIKNERIRQKIPIYIKVFDVISSLPVIKTEIAILQTKATRDTIIGKISGFLYIFFFIIISVNHLCHLVLNCMSVHGILQ